MFFQSSFGHTLSLCLFLGAFAGSAFAQMPEGEPALTHSADDEGLAWGPCPEFLPEGCGIAVLHGDPSQANLDIFLKFPGRSDIASHWHTSAERMILVSGELHVTYEGQPDSVLKAGSYAYGPAKRPHHARCASDEPCVLFIAFEEPLDAVPIETPQD